MKINKYKTIVLLFVALSSVVLLVLASLLSYSSIKWVIFPTIAVYISLNYWAMYYIGKKYNK